MTKQIKVSENTHTELINYKENNNCKSIDEVIIELLQNPIVKQRFSIGHWEGTDWILDNEEVITSKQAVELLNEQSKEITRLEYRLHEVLEELYCKDRILEEKGIDIGCCDK